MLSDPSFIAPTGRRNLSLVGAGCAFSLLFVSWPMSGCSLDERTLSVEAESTTAGSGGRASNGGSLGSGAGGVRSSGGAPTADAGSNGDGGDAGASGGGPPTIFPDGCSDLDHDGVSDCTQTLMQNPDFKLDVSHWTPEPGVNIDWDAMDLLAAPGSGSALISSTNVSDNDGDFLGTASQCLVVKAGNVLDLYANVRIEAGMTGAKAALSLWFFRAADCSDETPAAFYLTNSVFDTSATLTLTGNTIVGSEMLSVRVRLGVIKPFRANPVSVRFDNVLVVAH